MKKLFFIFVLFAVFATPIFAQEEPAVEERPEFTYAMNGKGDQYIRIGLMPFFPLNFGKQMSVGGALIVGYHRFLNSWLALGGDFMATYNPTKGGNIFYTIPLTASITFQPYVWKFEFPISLNVGMAFESSANRKYFPGLVLGMDAGVYYRMNDSWSFGAATNFLYLPQWYSGENETRYGKYDYGLFMTAMVSARYHF